MGHTVKWVDACPPGPVSLDLMEMRGAPLGVDKDTRESAFVVKRVRGGGGWISTTYRVRCLFCGWETNTGRTPAGRCGRCGGHIAQAPAEPVKTARRAPLGGYQPTEKHTKPDPTPPPGRK